MNPLRILHLEDSPLDGDLVRAWITRGGIVATIDRVENRAMFEDHLCKGHYDLILADYALPDFDGVSALAMTRRKNTCVPFIFVSGTLGEEVAIETLKQGATDYVLKQHMERLAPAIERALAEARERDEKRRAVEALREADRRKDVFLAMLAHELRNPLSAISNSVQLARLPDASPQRIAWSLDVIHNQVDQLSHLIDDLLDVTRITQGKIQLRKRVLDPAEIARRAVEAVSPLADERGHELICSIDDRLPSVEADPTRIEQVLVNLLSNAVKYTESRGRIELALSGTPEIVSIRVKDNGVGIPVDMQSRIFEPFAQVESSLHRSRGGLGVGLTLVKKLVEIHEGKVHVRSEGVGSGSEFIVELPAAKQSRIVGDRTRSGIDRSATPRRFTILVVDDNFDAAAAVASFLELSGFEVVVAHDGRSGIETARKVRPRLVLLDIGLPVVDGYQVAADLRSHPETRNILIVGLTGYGEDNARERSRHAGFDHHLVKPVELAKLVELVDALIAEQESRPDDFGRELAHPA